MSTDRIDGFHRRKLTDAIVVHISKHGSIQAIGENGLKATVIGTRARGEISVGDHGEIWFSVIGREGAYSFIKTGEPTVKGTWGPRDRCIFCGRVFTKPQQRVHATRRETLTEYWGFKCRKVCDARPVAMESLLGQGPGVRL